MRIVSICIFYFLLFLAIPKLGAQSIDFEFLSVADGLSQNTVRCLLQDRQGFIWLGTEYGLNRYDGYSFTVYRNALGDSTTLADNRITALHQDNRGNIWVGTASGGLHQFITESNKFIRYQHDPNNKNSISDNRITAIGSTETGVLWVGTKDKGLNRLDVEQQQFSRVSYRGDNMNSPGDSCIYEITSMGESALWIGHGRGFDLLDVTTDKFTHYFTDKIKDITAIKSISNSTLWLGSRTGLWAYNLDTEEEEQLLDNIQVTAIHIGNNDEQWIASNKGLWHRKTEKEEFEKFEHSPADRSSLSSSNIKCILEDQSGILWIGTYGGGVNKYLPSKQRFGHFKSVVGNPATLTSNYVTALLEVQSELVLVGTAEGLDIFNSDGEKIDHYHANSSKNKLSNSYITCLYAAKSGEVLIGTRNGLNIFNPSTQSMRPWGKRGKPLSNSHIYSLYEDEAGMFWVGTGEGLNKLNPQTGEVSSFLSEPDNPIGLRGNIITALYPSANGWLWVGTYNGGFYKFNMNTEIFKGYWSNKEDEERHAVLCLLETSENDLWIGTFDSGFHHFLIKEEQFERYSISEGMPNNQVYGMLEDNKNNIWCSTSDRLVRFNPDSESFRSYDIKDGLQGNEFIQNAYAKGHDGKLYFGGPNGFNAFDPAEIQDNKYAPNVVITGFELFNQAVSVSKEGVLNTAITELNDLELKHWQHSFAFEFAGLSYQLPERNQYAYFMEGLDDDWQYIGYRRKAYFTDLDPGVYHFKVKATNSDGVWNQEATAVRIEILPPFWKTWWFLLALVVVVAISTWLLYRQFQRQVAKKLVQMAELLKVSNDEARNKQVVLNNTRGELRDLREELNQYKDQALAKDQELRKYQRNLQENLEYASKIQLTQLPHVEELKTKIPNSFILHQSKMLVGGDFYWLSEVSEQPLELGRRQPLVIAVGECAGKGVSGALLSMVGMQILSRIVDQDQVRNSKKIVDKLSSEFSRSLNYNQQGNAFFGMDLALCVINWSDRKIEFVGAMRPLIYITGGKLFVIQGNSYPIGMAEIEGLGHGFTRHTVSFVKPTVFYMLTDGFEDQIGGASYRKFRFRRLKELLLSIHELPMDMQQTRLKQEFTEWKGDEVQIDDLCIIGFKLSANSI